MIKGDETLIKGGIKQTVQRDAVADVEPFRFVIGPRQDVRGNEQFPNGQACDGAAVVIVVQHRIPEIALATALFGWSQDFGVAHRLARNAADPGAGNDLGGFVGGIDKEGVEVVLAEWNPFGWVLMKRLPHFSIKIAGTFESMDATQLQCRVKRCKVTEFHRNGTRRATKPFGEIDDHWLTLVKLPEAEFVIKVEDDEELFTGPTDSVSHSGNLCVVSGGCKVGMAVS